MVHKHVGSYTTRLSVLQLNFSEQGHIMLSPDRLGSGVLSVGLATAHVKAETEKLANDPRERRSSLEVVRGKQHRTQQVRSRETTTTIATKRIARTE